MPRKNAKKSGSQSTKSKSSRASKSSKPSKASYVRSLPATLSAKDVVVKAKSQGITLTDAYVYNVRATAKIGKKKRQARGRKI